MTRWIKETVVAFLRRRSLSGYNLDWSEPFKVCIPAGVAQWASLILTARRESDFLSILGYFLGFPVTLFVLYRFYHWFPEKDYWKRGATDPDLRLRFASAGGLWTFLLLGTLMFSFFLAGVLYNLGVLLYS